MVDYLKECMKDPVPREWSFPEPEYRARLEKTRKAMDQAGIDVLLVHAMQDRNPIHLEYLVGICNRKY